MCVCSAVLAAQEPQLLDGGWLFSWEGCLGMVAREPVLGPLCVCGLFFLFYGVVVSGGLCSLLCRLCLGCCDALEVAEGGWVYLVFEGGSPASRSGFRLD